MTNFYRIVEDPRPFARWLINEPVDMHGIVVSAWNFRRGEPYRAERPLVMPLYTPGPQLDFNFSVLEAVVTSADLNAEMESRFRIRAQRIAVTVESTDTRFEILNVLDHLRCIDERRSEFTKWGENDGRPDKVGQYRMFSLIRINPAAVMGYHLFRIHEWPIALIASAQLKQFLEKRRVTGIDFVPVTEME